MHKKIITIISAFILFTSKANSLEDPNIQTSLGVFPAIVETVLSADTTKEVKITLTNLSNFSQPIKTLKQSFTPREKLELNETEQKIYDASSWIYILPEHTDFILQPKESKDIILYITQPPNASPGGHYATIYFQPLIPQELVANESIFVYARVAVLVFMQTPGEIVENTSYKEFNFPFINNPGNIDFNLSIQNLGNTHIQPTGNIKIFNRFDNQLIQSFAFPSSIILPGTSKTFPIEINISDYFGAYYIEADLNYGSNAVKLNSGKKEFFIFPYSVTIFFFVPLIFIITYILLFRQRIKKAIAIFLPKDKDNEAYIKYPPSLYKLQPRFRFSVKNGKRKF